MAELITPTPVSSVNHESGDVIEPTSLGVELASTRQRMTPKLSIKAVAKKLNLSVFTIECLESDQFDELPPRLFVRGYVRAYAALLSLPVEQMLRRFDLLYPPEEDTPMAPPEKTIGVRMRKPSFRVRRRLNRSGKKHWGRRFVLAVMVVAVSVLVFRWVKSGATQANLSTNVVSLQSSSPGSTPLVLHPKASH